MHPRTKRLHEIMAQYKLNHLRVAAMVGRSPNTVRVWRVKKPGHRVIPQHTLELLERKAAERAAEIAA